MKASVINTDYSEMWLEDGIIHQVYKPNLIITIQVAKAMVQDRLRISEGITRPMFVDIRNLVAIDSESREYFSSDEAVYLLSAGAILLGSSLKYYIAGLAGNVFLTMDRPKIPAKLFNNKERAIKWLHIIGHLN